MILLAIGGFSWAFKSRIGIDLIERYWTAWYIGLLVMTFITLASGVGYYIKNQNVFEDCE